MKITIIARCDSTGLGIQSRNWVKLLNPNKVIVINSKPFNGNEQNYDWYKNRKNAFIVDGFIKQHEIAPILNNTDLLLTFEIPYNYQLIAEARRRGIKTIIQNNWEFTDYLLNPLLPLPDILMNQSYWHLDDQKSKWPDITEYCPVPLDIDRFSDVYEQNINRTGKKRFLHIAGRGTHLDRNGTIDLIEAIKLIPKEIDFELVIKTQTVDVPFIDDGRVIVEKSSVIDEKEMYRGFDVVVMPRRYGGGCLPANESLASGLPVIMTDIDPNNKVLPNYWLVAANKKTSFMARTMVDVYSANHTELASRIAQFAVISDSTMYGYKIMAREIAIQEYSEESVFKKWTRLISKLGV